MSRVSRRSRGYCDDTCPAVDSVVADWVRQNAAIISPAVNVAVEAMVEQIKQVGTYKLRDALEAAVSDLEGTETKLETAEEQLAAVNRDLDRLAGELASLEALA